MNEGLSREQSEQVHVAAIVGLPELARELERLGLADPDESLEDARKLRPGVLRFGPGVLDPDRAGRIRAVLVQHIERLRRARGEIEEDN